MNTKLLVADKRADRRTRVRALAEAEPDVDVVGEAGDEQGLLALTAELRPAVVVLELGLLDLQGGSLMHELQCLAPGLKLLVLSPYGDSRYVVRALHAGAAGYLLSQHATDEFGEAIRTLISNQIYISPGIAGIAKEHGDVR